MIWYILYINIHGLFISPVVSVAEHTWFIRYIYAWNLQFQNNVIIIKAGVLLPQEGQTKDYEIGICCFSAKHAALRKKSKDWLTRNQDNVSELF
jgi:hypothetical protein